MSLFNKYVLSEHTSQQVFAEYILCTVSPLHPQVSHLLLDQTFAGGGGGGGSSRKFPQTKLEFAALATIYIAFTLYLQLFT